MRLSSQTMLVGAIVSIVACNDIAAPPTPPAGYVLDNVNGRALPTFVSPIPEGPTILSATMELGASGKASLTEFRREMDGTELFFTTTYTYVIAGNHIQFDYDPPCPPNALCAAPPKGTISGSRLTLEMYGSNSGIVFEFRYVGTGGLRVATHIEL
jgi:hypothetical protein